MPYNQCRTKGTLESVGLPVKITGPQHRLSNRDLDSKTAECEICGPTEIEFVKSRRKWRCATKANEWRTSYKFTGGTISADIALIAREQLHIEQQGKCALCPEPATHLDHCHDTGKIRGLLCVKCNSGLGMFKDSVETLKAAIDYLSR